MSFDPALYSGLLRSFEFSIEQALRYDPGTQRQIEQWEGRHILIDSTSPRLTCHVLFVDSKIQLRSYCESTPDCQITGRLKDIAALAGHDVHSLANTGVEVRGDIALLSQLQKLAKQIDIDWEQALADVVGDTAASALGRMIRQQSAWLQERFSEIPQWLPDYLSEELQATPSANELQSFYEDIYLLQQDVERLTARLQKAATSNHPPTTPRRGHPQG